MRKKILSLFFVFLLVSFPFVQGAEIVEEEDFDEQDTGESIAINVKSYEPTILTSNLLEDGSVPVYVFLAGSTLGTLLGSSTNLEPVYGGIEVEKMIVKPQNIETNDFLEGEPKWYKPNKFDVDTLGYVTVTLKQFDPDNFEICSSDSACDDGYTCETGACIPKEINLSFTADIWFKDAERLYSLSKSALILPVDADEDTWAENLGSYGSMYSFYGGRGLVRVKDISDNGVDLTVYSNKDLYWPVIGAPRAIADVHLDKGETSDYLDLGFTDEQILGNAKFRITLNSLKDPAQERAVVAVTIGGSRSQVVVTEGASLFPGSTWTVKDMASTEGRSGVEYILTLKDSKGNVKKITTSQAGGLSEEESAVLNKKFSQKQTEDTFYYNAETKKINPTSLENLQDVFRHFNIDLDISAVASDSAQTRAVILSDEKNLKQVLFEILPAGYYYSIVDAQTIKIHKFASEDPCIGVEIYGEEGLAEIFAEVDPLEKVDNRLKLNMLCTGVSHFEQVLVDADDEVLVGTEIAVRDFAYLRIAESYDALARISSLSTEQIQGAKEKSLEAYQKLVDRNSPLEDSSLLGKIQVLQNELFGQFSYGSASLEDNGQFVFVEFLSLEQLGREKLSSAVLRKDGEEKTYYVGDVLFSGTEGKNSYTWYLYSVSEDTVQIRKVYSSLSKVSFKTLEADGKVEVIEESTFQLKSTDTKQEAYLTITPGTGESLRSRSNFSVHIPIESRAFDLNPMKIDDRIAKVKELQEKLDKIVSTLEKIVKTWNYVCYGVFAYVSLKSSFVSASAQARHDAIHGVDDKSGWAAYCEEHSIGLAYSERKKEGNYLTYDECMLANAAAIDRDIHAAEDARESVENIENIDSSEEIQDIIEGYNGNLQTCEDLLGEQVFLDEESKKEYVYLKRLQADGSLSATQQDALQEKLDSYTGKNTAYQTAKQTACNKVAEGITSHGTGKEAEDKQLAIGVYERVYNEQLAKEKGVEVEEASVKSFPALNTEDLGIEIAQVGRVFSSEVSNKKYTVYRTDSSVGQKVTVSAFTYDDYQSLLEKKVDSLGGDIQRNDDGEVSDIVCKKNIDCTQDKDLLQKYEKDLKKIDDKQDISTQGIVADTGAKYYWDGTNIYVGQPAYSSGSISEKYAAGAKIEIYASGESKGLPYCLPHQNGNFIKFTDYTINNEIETMQYWNVGSDGQLCTPDDVLLAHESELHYQTASPSYNDLVTFANKWVKKTWYAGETQEIGGHLFKVSYGKSKVVQDGATASCFDVMDPGDCKLLFNTCDPVMCPPSRFNFGGRYQVDSVVESGIIGSLILPYGSGDTVPVCLTGILASLHFWKSMLDGYVECLEAAKYEGKSVGVCDKVRSVYTCELIVREAAAIMDNNEDGLLDFLANKAYGQEDRGGGEYFQFKENLENVQNSFSYFTTEYSTTAFAAFKGRSLEEVGSSICQQAIYAQTPWFTDFMDQVTTPEDPNQFYATLTVRPYAPSLGISSYQTYYHIYAGVNPNIENVVYQVYLKNSLTGEVFYSTEECKGVSASLELGGMSDKTLDCLAPEGLDTVCVVMNGETNCGFGTVSTAFSYDYLKDVIVADEAKREISTEKECYPSVSVASPKASSLASLGSTDTLALPYSYGALSTGIQRVCALQDPGLGQGGQGDWSRVGSCGEDSEGRSLGYCWMNTDSFSIKDAERNELVQEHIKDRNFDTLRSELEEFMDEEKSAEAYAAYISHFKAATQCKDYVALAQELKNLYDETISYVYAVNAQYSLGLVYYYMGSNQYICGLEGRTEIEVDASLDGHSLDSFNEDDTISAGKIIERDGLFAITFSKLQEGEEPVGVLEVGGEEIEVPCSPGDQEGEYICSREIGLLYTAEDDVIDITFTIERKGEETFTRSYRLYAGEDEEKDEAFASVAAACNTCGGSAYDSNVCDVDECGGISGCYFEGSLLGKLGFSNGDCLVCADLKEQFGTDKERCGALSDDQETCEKSSCYTKFLKDDDTNCYWDEKEEKCAFSGDEEEPRAGVVISRSLKCEASAGLDDYENAFLDAIASVEGPSYNSIYPSSTFNFDTCTKGHPKDADPSSVHKDSSAAGRYQFTYGTYSDFKDDSFRGETLFQDFCKESQDLGALALIEGEGIDSADIREAYKTKEWTLVFDAVANRWAAFPYSKDDCGTSTCGRGDSYYAGDGLNSAASADKIIATFEKCLLEHQSGEATSFTEGSILIIGDSHTQGIYGTELYNNLKESSDSVTLYAVAGANPLHFVKGSSFSSGGTRLEGTDIEKDTTGSGRTKVTSISTLLASYNPEIVVLTFGSNLYGSSPETIVSYSEQLASAIVNEGASCYWVGPPQGPRYSDLEDYQAYKEAIEAGVEGSCTFIDSEEYTEFNFCGTSPSSAFGCDGQDGVDVHFDSYGDDGDAAAADWAEGVSQEIVQSGL